VTAAPTCTAAPPEGVAKNVTEVIVAPAVAVAEAVTVVAVPTVAVELLAGAVSATEVEVTAVTVIAADVTVAPLESSTRAVMFCAPAAVGTHVIEYGAEVSTPIKVVPA
jgi:hypothetical protein